MSQHPPNDPDAKRGENLLREPLPWLVIGATLFCLWGGSPWSGGGLHQGTKAKVQTAKTQIGQFKAAVQLFTIDNGHAPKSLDELIHQPSHARNWKKYLPDLNEIPEDPWGSNYVYQSPGPQGEPFRITCYGANCKPGGHGNDADIESTQVDVGGR